MNKKNINDIQLSSDSDDFDHPNIDKRSFREFKRRQKEEKKKEKAKRLEQIEEELLQSPNNDKLLKEKEKLQFDLSEKLIEVDKAVVINDSEKEKTNDYEKFYEYLIPLLEKNDIHTFVKFLDSHHDLDVAEFENFVLLNLIESIKDNNDEAGIDLSRLSLYLKYSLQHGKAVVCRLRDAMLTDKSKQDIFEKEVQEHYIAAKNTISNPENFQ